MYWLLIPEPKRGRCIFKKSCSHYVFEIEKQVGFSKGIKAFYFRYKNCRSNFDIFQNANTNQIQMLLPTKIIVGCDEIADRLLTK